MKVHDRVCPSCGEITQDTRTRSNTCMKCYRQEKSFKTFEADRALLESMYTNVDGPSEPNKNNKREWSFTHSCGKHQTWVIGNIKGRLKINPDKIPCSGC